MLFEENSVVVMTGDSVTDCGRNYADSTCSPAALGNGYVQLVHAALAAYCPERNILILNRGVSGDTSEQLKARWQKDVLGERPDYISIMIGVNDVWRHFDGTVRQSDFISAEKYRGNYCALLDAALPQVKGVLVISPCMFDLNRSDPMGRMVREYADVARAVAKEYGQLYIDVQNSIDSVLQHRASCVYSADRVHPTLCGHMVVARAVLDAVTNL
ncbi:SGNH/GDSL hydrolase family protein [Treponema brennaborense]|uniref:Lipolytic protein G-D-S-L family n=1 Tax=Treponema brennaborense (strain DSM 12168 / CIP 105900 / DD5/3) TaxID=906968 RepID=F4LIT9_TREBD|nr:SGNH/GDSL hydrolase family protein [Treponema brennaborense]AEE16264.1 lipolytic protein G-D-S-L family [Treponema brennaborense DSM 12168]